ncbi:MAG: DsbA family protein [Pseudomonadota bacterium]
MMRHVFAAACLVLAVPLSAMAQSLSEAELKALVLDTIRENPEIVMEAVEILRAREAEAQAARAAEVLSSQRDLLERDPNAPVLGNPDGDVTLVEFFDYNCGFCKQVFPRVKALIDEDPNLRVVMREWPILSEGSIEAARLSLAAREQGMYNEFHDALMASRGRAGEATALRIAEDLGLDVDKLKEDAASDVISAHIDTSRALSEALGVSGTPAFVIGSEIVPGAIELDDMKALIAQARDAG